MAVPDQEDYMLLGGGASDGVARNYYLRPWTEDTERWCNQPVPTRHHSSGGQRTLCSIVTADVISVVLKLSVGVIAIFILHYVLHR